MILRKVEYTGIWKKKNYIAFSGELALEEFMHVSQRYVMMKMCASYNDNLSSWECTASSGRMINECSAGWNVEEKYRGLKPTHIHSP
jgi:hypothetical protein